MTDLKNLLDEAAGDQPAPTDRQLAADLRRGRVSLRRRRLAGVGSGVAATAVVLGGVLPQVGNMSTAVEPGVATGPGTPSPSVMRSPRAVDPESPGRPVLPRLTATAPAEPVDLVPDGVVRPPSTLVCDLMPKGWRVHAWKSRGNADELIITEPSITDPSVHTVGAAWIRVRHARFFPDDQGRLVVPEKYKQRWDELPHVRAGAREAIVAPRNAPASDGLRDLSMKMSDTRLIQVANDAIGLGWDLPTLLRFAGSCHYKP